MCPDAYAQTADAPALKAAFVYNFAKFTEWPADTLPPGAQLVLCVAGDAEVGRALDQAASGRKIDGHPLAIWQGRPDLAVSGCHVLYIGRVDNPQAGALLDAVKGQPVLTVGDLPTFTRIGGAVQLFVENGRMRFAIHVEATQRARLRLSSRLLNLAKLVQDETSAPPR